jgi:Anti-sigma-K factor rskA
MMKSIVAVAGAACAGAAVLAGTGMAGGSTNDVRLSARNLPRLQGASYELWAIYGQQKLSAGKFNVTANGSVTGRLSSSRDPAEADMLAVTIEPRGDRNKAPSATVILAGKPSSAGARLSFPVDLRRISGSYLLATPTDDDDSNETAGIWFLTSTMKASLQVPAAPAGWAWEGWGATQSTPISTGRFSKAVGADASARYSGPKRGPAFPGEDFLRRLPRRVSARVDLADGSSMAVLTLEPNLAGKDPTGAGPFSIKPLVGKVPSGATDHRSLRLRRDLSGLPSGSARF